jgi:hypothetical protein
MKERMPQLGLALYNNRKQADTKLATYGKTHPAIQYLNQRKSPNG